MNTDLESLVKAFEAFLESVDPDAKKLRRVYLLRLEDIADKTGCSIDALEKAVKYQHRLWKISQRKQSTLPPKA